MPSKQIITSKIPKLYEETVAVTDNASNEAKAIANLGWLNISCLGHNINLAVKAATGVSGVSRILGKTRKLVSYFHKSPTAMGILLNKMQVVQATKYQMIR